MIQRAGVKENSRKETAGLETRGCDACQAMEIRTRRTLVGAMAVGLSAWVWGSPKRINR